MKETRLEQLWKSLHPFYNFTPEINQVKKTGILIVLLFLLMQSGGVLFFYQMKLCYARFQMEQLLTNDATQFQKLMMSNSNYQSSRVEEDEIKINGIMYDVKSVVFKDGEVELMVISDANETSLVNQIKKVISTKNHKHNQLPNHLIRLLSLIYIPPANGTSFFEPVAVQHNFLKFDKRIQLLQADINVPPPELV